MECSVLALSLPEDIVGAVMKPLNRQTQQHLTNLCRVLMIEATKVPTLLCEN